MINHDDATYTPWKSGEIQLTDEDLKEGLILSQLTKKEVRDNDVRSACFQADLFITFMVRLN